MIDPAKLTNPYLRDIRHLDEIDVYGILELYNVTDPYIQHAIKKLLVPGGRGIKTDEQDIREATNTLNMRAARKHQNVARR